jgi:hypothetical protein
MDRSEDALYQAQQRTIAIIDEYYTSIREDQACREAIRIAEREEERKRAAIFAEQMQRWRETQRLYVKKYMVEFDEQVQVQCNQINTML